MTRTLCSALLLIALPAVTIASDFDSLSKDIPQGANLALAIDVEKALASPLARSNNWNQRINDGSQPVYLPQETDKVIVAAQVDPVRGFKSAWEVAAMGLTESLPMRLVAKSEGGYPDTISGVDVAWVPSDAYFITIEPLVMGMMHPANRQAVARWIGRQQSNRGPEISDYLASGIRRVKDGPQFVIVLDLQDVVQPHRVHDRLAQSDVVQKHKLNIDDLAEVIGGIKGLVLEITVTDKAVAKVQIDFNKPVTFTSGVAKELILGALTTFQAELPGAEKWAVTVSGSSIACHGDVGDSAFRRILSMLEIPSTKFSSLKGQNTETSTGDDMARNSLAYFQAITKLVDDLQEHSKSHNGDYYWMDRYSQKIDRLPILHVDPDLLDFGQKTVETLRVMSGARKGANLRTGVAQSNIIANSGPSYGSYALAYSGHGYAAVRRNARSTQSSMIAAQEANTASASATKIQGFQLISEATSQMRRAMTERYNIEF